MNSAGFTRLWELADSNFTEVFRVTLASVQKFNMWSRELTSLTPVMALSKYLFKIAMMMGGLCVQ